MYCTRDELKDYVFTKYLEKIEALEPGLIARHISGVSAEIDDALRVRFAVPLQVVPETIRRIARVMVSFRCVGAITSIMKTEASSENVWLPLQIQYRQALKDLEAIAEGKLDVGLEALGNDEGDGEFSTAIATHSRPGVFNKSKYWEKF